MVVFVDCEVVHNNLEQLVSQFVDAKRTILEDLFAFITQSTGVRFVAEKEGILVMTHDQFKAYVEALGKNQKHTLLRFSCGFRHTKQQVKNISPILYYSDSHNQCNEVIQVVSKGHWT